MLFKKVLLPILLLCLPSFSLADAALEQKIRAFILNNPEVIVDSLQRYQQQQARIKEQDQQRLITELIPLFKQPNQFPAEGSKDDRLVIIEFLDYQCGFCKRAHGEIKKTIEAYADLRVIYVDTPILGPASKLAAQAVLAARDQGKYLALHNALLQNRGPLNESRLLDLAKKVGLDVARLQQQMTAPSINAQITRNLQIIERLGIRGTPAFIFGDRVVAGFQSFADMTKHLEVMR